jgi:uncharacterized membrane protein
MEPEPGGWLGWLIVGLIVGLIAQPTPGKRKICSVGGSGWSASFQGAASTALGRGRREGKMRELIVLKFGEAAAAGHVLGVLRDHEAARRLRLADTAVVVKDEAMSVQFIGEVSGATERGALVGGAAGLVAGTLAALILLTIGVAVSPAGLLLVLLVLAAGVAAGAAGGALVGWSIRAGIDRPVVQDVGVALPPGSSALVLLVRAAEPPVLEALRIAAEASEQVALLPDATAALLRTLGGVTQSGEREDRGQAPGRRADNLRRTG